MLLTYSTWDSISTLRNNGETRRFGKSYEDFGPHRVAGPVYAGQGRVHWRTEPTDHPQREGTGA